MRVKTKLLVTFLSIAIIPMLFIGVLGFYNSQNALRGQALENLNNIAEGKEAQILEFLASKKARAVDFASDGFIRSSLEQLLTEEYEDKRNGIFENLQTHLIANKKPLDKDILDIHVINVEGVIVVATHEAEVGNNESGEHYFSNALRETYVDDARQYEGHREEVFIAVATPIKSMSSNKTIGVLMNSYSLKNIIEFTSGERAKKLGAPTTIETTGSRDIFLVNQNGLMLVPSKKMEEFSSMEHDMRVHPAVVECVEAQAEINAEWTDSRGISVFGSSMCPQIEKDWKWTLVVEQDIDEVMASVKGLRSLTLIIGIITLLFATLIAFVVAKTISNPIQKLTQVADDISKGKLDSQIEEINSKDEIGELARSFNRTVTSLKLAMRETSPELKKKLEEKKKVASEIGKTIEKIEEVSHPKDK